MPNITGLVLPEIVLPRRKNEEIHEIKAAENRIPEIKMGAVTPYNVYSNEVQPYFRELDNLKGTQAYYIKWTELFPKIESGREKYLNFFPAMLSWVATAKIVSDYYVNLGYKTKDTDGEKIDKKYNIDLIAEGQNEIVVAQIKSGSISKQQIKKFFTNAPDYIQEKHGDKQKKKLVIVFLKINKGASAVFSEMAAILLKEKTIAAEPLPIEKICNEIPKYKRLFKELNKLRSRTKKKYRARGKQ